MKNKLLLLSFSLVFVTKVALAQCEVKKITLKQGLDRYSMTENFIERKDYENGLGTVYFSVNYHGDKSDKIKPMVITMVVTCAWTGNREKIVPNTLWMKLPSGKSIVLSAEEKSTGTLNVLTKVPPEINSIECIFNVPLEDVKLLLEERSAIINVLDSNTGSGFKNISKYEEQVPEMLSCVIK